MSKAYSNNINSFNVANVSNHFTVASDRSEILHWLSPLEPSIRHQDIRTCRVANVGDWLLRTGEFRRWCDGNPEGESDKAILFGYGDPGVGKTYISSLVIDTLCDQARGTDTTVACFYFDFASRGEQSPTRMLGSLLRQIVSGLRNIPAEIAQAFEDQKRVIGGRGLQLSEIVKMLQAITSSRRTFLCLDALDECAEEHRPDILDSLRQVLERSPNTRVFLTGRPQIRGEIERRLAGRTAIVSITPSRDDIVGYLRTRLDKDTTLGAMNSDLEKDILSQIPESVSEIFLLVFLNIEAVLQETTLYRRRERLRTMSHTLRLGDAYDATLERIRAQGRERARLGMATLMWVSHSERPLHADELCHALAVEGGVLHLNTHNVPSIWTLLSCCQGLVSVDKEASTVRLVHFTLQEYLSAQIPSFSGAHATISATCLTYLNFQHLRDLSPTLDAPPETAPFIEYCSLYWGVHAQREISSNARSLVLKLFNERDNLFSTGLLFRNILLRLAYDIHSTPTEFPSQKYRNALPVGFTGLHCASFFGIVDIAVDFLKMEGCDINQKDCAGITPLIWAAISGKEEMVKLLLDRQDVNSDISDTECGRTALSWAVGNGYEGVVRLILDRKDVKADKPDRRGQTPLSKAAENGHEETVKLLLKREDVDPDRANNDGRTPLSRAAQGGHEGVMRLLLERKLVNPERKDKWGRTPLSRAAEDGHDGVVKLLLGREDISPDSPSNNDQTPLSWAAENGRDGVVKLLLEREDISPNSLDNRGQTPLSRAAENGRDGAVKLLLGREDANPDRPDNRGRTPLSWAARYGHDRVVKLLLGREDVSTDRPGESGLTPLSLAAKNGHDRVVKLLLGREEVNLDRLDNHGQTPLSLAAMSGHDEVLKLLLGREDVDPNRPDNCSRTPLWWAAFYGRNEVVKLLLGREDVSLDRPDTDGQTPLSLAAANGHGGVVKLLLEREDVNPDRPDNRGRTPLSWAAKNGRYRAVKLLLGHKDVDPDKLDFMDQTPLFLAIRNGHTEVAKLLPGMAHVKLASRVMMEKYRSHWPRRLNGSKWGEAAAQMGDVSSYKR